ncbi:MAG: flagellar filament capping protein FliD [Chloroflexota bacterium]
MATTSISNVNTYFTSLINDLMAVERRPLTILQTRKTDLESKNSIFTDLGSKFSTLQSVVDDLIAGGGLAVFDKRAATVTPSTANKTVLTASASNGAAAATYTINVAALAVQHSVSSDQQSGVSQALNLSGTITLGGTALNIVADDTLNGIAGKINNASYSSGNAVKATVIDRKLILTANETGNDLSASDTSGSVLQSLGVLDGGGAFKNLLRTKSAASFTINDLPSISSGSNQGITAIGGVTFNLAADAALQTATITVTADNSAIRTKAQDFLTKLNDLTTYLSEKSAITSTTNDKGKTVYKRGALAEDYSYSSLKSDLINDLSGSFYGLPSGAPTMLSEIGISLDDNLKFTVTDSSKLESALTTNPSGAKALLQKAAEKVDTLLKQFSGSSGTLTYSQKSVTDEIGYINAEVAGLNSRFAERRTYLEDYYATLQAQVISNIYLQQQLSSFGSFNVLG